jgi:hypothetical protein
VVQPGLDGDSGGWPPFTKRRNKDYQVNMMTLAPALFAMAIWKNNLFLKGHTACFGKILLTFNVIYQRPSILVNQPEITMQMLVATVNKFPGTVGGQKFPHGLDGPCFGFTKERIRKVTLTIPRYVVWPCDALV